MSEIKAGVFYEDSVLFLGYSATELKQFLAEGKNRLKSFKPHYGKLQLRIDCLRFISDQSGQVFDTPLDTMGDTESFFVPNKMDWGQFARDLIATAVKTAVIGPLGVFGGGPHVDGLQIQFLDKGTTRFARYAFHEPDALTTHTWIKQIETIKKARLANTLNRKKR